MLFNHKMLYEGLYDITVRGKKALDENDIETLVRLGKEHENIMNDLKQTGLNNDPQMVGMIKKIKIEVDELVVKMEREQNKTGKELKKIVNGKKLVAAYG